MWRYQPEKKKAKKNAEIEQGVMTPNRAVQAL
jgi:hypothetical protein